MAGGFTININIPAGEGLKNYNLPEIKNYNQLDDVHVVFGQVVEGLDVVRIISHEPLKDKLSKPVVIDCGQIK
ncbi:hypothetical protein YC2023_054926 [Brassica napus]